MPLPWFLLVHWCGCCLAAMFSLGHSHQIWLYSFRTTVSSPASRQLADSLQLYLRSPCAVNGSVEISMSMLLSDLRDTAVRCCLVRLQPVTRANMAAGLAVYYEKSFGWVGIAVPGILWLIGGVALMFVPQVPQPQPHVFPVQTLPLTRTQP